MKSPAQNIKYFSLASIGFTGKRKHYLEELMSGFELHLAACQNCNLELLSWLLLALPPPLQRHKARMA